MITDTDRIAAERELAELLGWTDIQLGGKRGDINIPETWLTGRICEYIDDALTPQWTRQWAVCGPLIGEYGIEYRLYEKDMEVRWPMLKGGYNCRYEKLADHPTKDDAIRYAIVQAVIAKLKAEKEQPCPK